MSWKNTLRKSPTKTATRTADLWSINDEVTYFKIVNFIKEEARKELDKDKIFNKLTRYLPEVMSHLDGFMEELTEREPIDGLSDVDWIKVAENFEEDIKEKIEFFKE